MSVSAKVYKQDSDQLSESARYIARKKLLASTQPAPSLGIPNSKLCLVNAAKLATKSTSNTSVYVPPKSQAALLAASSSNKPKSPRIATSVSSASPASWHSGYSSAAAAAAANSSTAAYADTCDTSVAEDFQDEEDVRHNSAYAAMTAYRYNANNVAVTLENKSYYEQKTQGEKKFADNAAASADMSVLLTQNSAASVPTAYTGPSKSISSANIDFSKLNSVAAENASVLTSMRLAGTHKPGLQNRNGLTKKYLTNTEKVEASHAAMGASKATASDLLSVNAANNKRQSFNYNGLSSPSGSTSIAGGAAIDSNLARVVHERVRKTLQEIDDNCRDSYIFSNEKFNEQAIAVAKKRVELGDIYNSGYYGYTNYSRAVDGKYDLGGGLKMNVEDVEAIARKFVLPVLEEINMKAEEQRKIDEEYAEKEAELKQQLEEHEKAVKQLKLENKNEMKQVKELQKKEIEEVKQEYSLKKQELRKVKDEEINNQKQILEETQKKHDLILKNLNETKLKQTTELDKELVDFKLENQNELRRLTLKNQELLKPILLKIAAETKNYDGLVVEEQALQKLVDSKKKINEFQDELLKKSKNRLETAEKELNLSEEMLRNAKSEQEILKAQQEIEIKKHEVAKRITEQKQNQASKKQSQDDEELTIKQHLRVKKEMEFKEEAMKALDEEKKLATEATEAIGTASFNENKIKALEAEIKQIALKEEAKEKAEREKEYQEELAMHEATIRDLELQKEILAKKQEDILKELRASDAKWKELHADFKEATPILDEEEENMPIMVESIRSGKAVPVDTAKRGNTSENAPVSTDDSKKLHPANLVRTPSKKAGAFFDKLSKRVRSNSATTPAAGTTPKAEESQREPASPMKSHNLFKNFSKRVFDKESSHAKVDSGKDKDETKKAATTTVSPSENEKVKDIPNENDKAVSDVKNEGKSDLAKTTNIVAGDASKPVKETLEKEEHDDDESQTTGLNTEGEEEEEFEQQKRTNSMDKIFKEKVNGNKVKTSTAFTENI